MKKLLYIVFAAVTLVAMSCQQQYLMPDVPDVTDQGLILKFTASEMLTKAESIDNEDMVKQIEYFLFPVNSEGKVDDTTKFVYNKKITPENGLAGTYTEVIQPGVLAKLFPDGATSAVVFAVANYCTSDNTGTFSIAEIPDTAKTWASLHNLEVGATFFKAGGPGFGKRWPRVMQPNDENLFFVMAADSVGVQLHTSGSYAIDAEIPMERLASKVTVNFNYYPVVEVKEGGNITWVPQPSGKETRVYLSNAICNTTLGGPLTRPLNPDGGKENTPWLDRDIFEYAYDFMNDIEETIITPASGDTPAVTSKIAHYYTYPIQMEEGDDNQPFIKLVLPWYGYKWIGEGNAPATVDTTVAGWRLYKQKEVYYKIALPRESITEPNRIYDYSVDVKIIGTDKEVSISGDYVIKDWLTRQAISSNVATGRYISLDIPKDEYNMYTDEIKIAFVSSGTVVAKVDSIYQFNYSSATTSKDLFMLNDVVPASASQGNPSLLTRKGIAAADIDGWVDIPTETSYLKINHEMDNNMTKIQNNQVVKNEAFDMAPYVFVVTLHLVEAGDDHSFDRTVTITQYPPMFVTSKHSDGYVFVNGYSSSDSYCLDDASNRLGNISSAPGSMDGSQNNRNPNNYIITTSVLSGLTLPVGDPVIADPRYRDVQNLSNLALTNYYPTNPIGTEKMIAPKFIVASSYSSLTADNSHMVNRDAAEKRCAAYQENGYPAGRWRVPTAAEIMFMATLSKYSFIPSLFNFTNQYGYRSANGKVRGDGSGEPALYPSDDSGAGVRCVYDAWYWGEEPVFTGTEAQSWKGYYDNK